MIDGCRQYCFDALLPWSHSAVAAHACMTHSSQKLIKRREIDERQCLAVMVSLPPTQPLSVRIILSGEKEVRFQKRG